MVVGAIERAIVDLLAIESTPVRGAGGAAADREAVEAVAATLGAPREGLQSGCPTRSGSSATSRDRPASRRRRVD